MITISCNVGLCSRVKALARALASAQGETVGMVWEVNKHCPVDHDVIFPKGIPGVDFAVVADTSKRAPGPAHVTFNPAQAFKTVLGAMIGSPMANPPSACIMLRALHLTKTQFAGVLLRVKEAFASREIHRVFVLSDCKRGALAAAVLGYVEETVLPMCRPMARDLDREPGDFLPFISDWKTACCARDIFTATPRSAMVFGPTMFGATIHHL